MTINDIIICVIIFLLCGVGGFICGGDYRWGGPLLAFVVCIFLKVFGII